MSGVVVPVEERAARHDIPFTLTPQAAAAFSGRYFLCGIVLGGMSGGIVGTGIFPLLGTFWGAAFGAFAGAAAAIPIGLILLVVIVSQQASVRSAVNSVDAIAAGTATLIAFVACLRIDLFALAAGVPGVLAATFAARFSLVRSIGKSQREWIAQSDIGAGVRFIYVLSASVAGGIIFAFAWLTR